MSQVFGLGIVLNFVDNATSGMNSAAGVFLNMSQQMERASSSANNAVAQLAQGTALVASGNALIGFGNKVSSGMKGLMNNVKSVGSEFEGFKITLQQLFGSPEEAENQIQKLMDFSIKSPFEVADTKDLLVVLKSQGIDAFDSLKGSITGVEQETLTWISDLMAFKPDVAMSRWKLAFQNYLGSGEERVLRNVLDMGKISDILGHEAGKTVQDRMNDIIELIEKKNLTGLTENMFGTMQQNISNIGDFFTMFYKAVGDAGVFEKLSEIVSMASQTLKAFDYESGRLPIIAQIVADAFNAILSPMVSLSKGVSDLIVKFGDFAMAHPVLAKFAIVITMLTGASLVAVGWILKLSGSILMFAASIKLFGGVKSILNTLTLGFGKFGAMSFGLIAIGTLLYQAWKNNFMGIQQIAGDTYKKLELLWSYFKNGEFTVEEQHLAEKLGVIEAIEKIELLKESWYNFKTGFSKGFDNAFENIFTNIENGLVKIDETLKNLGIDTGLSSLLNVFNQSFEEFLINGNKTGGIEKLGESVGELAVNLIFLSVAINTVKTAVSVFKGLNTAIRFVGSAFNALKITQFLASVGKLIGGLLKGKTILASLANSFPMLVQPLIRFVVNLALIGGKISALFSTIGSALGTFFSTLGGILSTIGSAIMTGLTAIASALGISVGWVIAIIAAVIAAIVAVVVFWDEICYFFTDLLPNAISVAVNAVGKFFSDLWNTVVNSPIVQAIVTTVQTVINAVKTAIQAVVTFVTGIVNKVVSIFNGIVNFIKPIINVIIQVIRSVINLAILIGTTIGGVVGTIVNSIIAFVKIAVTFITGIAKTIATFVVGVAQTIWNTIKLIGKVVMVIVLAIVAGIKWVITSIVGVVTNIWNWLCINVFAPIGNFINTYVIQPVSNAINTVINFIKGIIISVSAWFSSVWWTISTVLTSIWTKIVDTFNTVKDFIGGIIQAIITKFQEIWGVVSNVFTIVWSFVSSIFNSIWSTVQTYLQYIANFFGSVADGLKVAWQSVSDFFSGIFNGIFGFADSCCQNITGAFNGVVSAIIGAFDWINNLISKADEFLSGVGQKLAKYIGIEIPGFATGVDSFSGGLAVINERGGELVDLPQGTRVIPHDESIKESLRDGVRLGVNALAGQFANQSSVQVIPASPKQYGTQETDYPTRALDVTSNGNSSNTKSNEGQVNYDYSVTFAAGSIVFNVPQGGTEDDYKKMAEYILKYIERTQQKKAMAKK